MLTLAFILAFIPVINFYLQYTFSKKDNILDQYKTHWTTYYGDFSFIFVNFFLLFSFNLNGAIYLVALLFSLFGNSVVHIIYIKQFSKPGGGLHLVDEMKKTLTKAGWVHFTFSSLETSLILFALISPAIYPAGYFFYLSIIIFAGAFLFGSYKIHKKVVFEDIIIAGFLLGAFSLKLFFF